MTLILNCLRNSKLLRIIILVSISLWCIGFLSPILFSDNPLYVFTPILKHIYSNVCHQQLYKSIIIGEQHILVCSRCSGIYIGILCASLFSVFKIMSSDKMIYLVIIAGGLVISDILCYNIGLYKYSVFSAFSTGLFLGWSVFNYILNEIDNYLLIILSTDAK
jgi:uncharacterized membrane protein